MKADELRDIVRALDYIELQSEFVILEDIDNSIKFNLGKIDDVDKYPMIYSSDVEALYKYLNTALKQLKSIKDVNERRKQKGLQAEKEISFEVDYNKENSDIEDLTDEELKQQYEIVRRELDNRNIEKSLPTFWNY